MTVWVDTAEDWLRVRETLEPVYVTSKTRGKVLVPCANTILIRTALVVGNTYNPNCVPHDKFNGLVYSVTTYGFLFPVIAVFDEETGLFVIVDGFHRRLLAGDEWLDLDYIPVAVLSIEMAARMAATWALNKFKGSHAVDLDAELIRKLIEQGLADEDIAARLGIDLDTVHRYKQVTGVAALFRGTEYSRAWEMVEQPDPEPGPGVTTSEGAAALVGGECGGVVQGEAQPAGAGGAPATGSLFPDEAGLGGPVRRRRPRK